MTAHAVRLGLAAAIVAASGVFMALASTTLVAPFLLLLTVLAGAIKVSHR